LIKDIAIIESENIVISGVNDALDLMATVRYDYNINKIILKKENIIEDFFDLKTRLAGEILQKYANYRIKLAIVGDFSSYNSKSLNDFIYECNSGNQFCFVTDTEKAVEILK